jgi:hypothetical protein
MDIIRAIVTQVDEELSRISDERRSEDLPGLKPLEIKVLGQMSLLMDPVGQSLNPAATRDIDALLMGDLLAINIFRAVIQSHNLVYDELSKDIWLPEAAAFIPYHSSAHLIVSYVDSISALTSKAVKAKEKNRYLIRRGLEVFGKPLEESIVRYGGDINYFVVGKLGL